MILCIYVLKYSITALLLVIPVHTGIQRNYGDKVNLENHLFP